MEGRGERASRKSSRRKWRRRKRRKRSIRSHSYRGRQWDLLWEQLRNDGRRTDRSSERIDATTMGDGICTMGVTGDLDSFEGVLVEAE